MSSTPVSVFLNYMQMRSFVPLKLWHAARFLSVAATFGLVTLLFVRPTAGITIWWGFFIPVLPLVFFLAPGLWRNVCPMAALNQTPRLFRFARGLKPPARLAEYGYVIAIALFLSIAASRKVIFNSNGRALAVLLLAALASAFVGGLIFKGKSGWCSSMCPLLPVQRVYGQTPFLVLPNSHCQPCVGCTRNCYDFNPRVAYLADLYDDDRHYSSYRMFFVGAFPGFVLAFYRVPTPPAISIPEMYLQFAVYVIASAGSFFLLNSFLRVTPNKITALYGAAALNTYYWYNFPKLAAQLHTSFSLTIPDAAVWSARGVVLLLTLVWAWRTYRKEMLFVAHAGPAAGQVRVSPTVSGMIRRDAASGGPEVTFVPDDRRIAVSSGKTLLEAAESAGMKIEAGCRMGMCGADPVAVVNGMDCLSRVTADEKTTLERLGFAENTRMACCARIQGPVTVALTPEKAKIPAASTIRGFRFDAAVKRVVVIGNGVAGTTAADHVRRRHPNCDIQLVAREPHRLYNRMAIERLIYGRSAMQGLYLLPEDWHEEHGINCLLNTRVLGIDRPRKEVALGTGERLPYDRLILATGSSSNVPAINGFGISGSFVLREAADAIQIRAFAQEYGCRTAVVAGGGLLGLEAAHALHKLGLRVAVLERSDGLLRRQLDLRGSGFLQEYLEGIGLEIVVSAEVASVTGNERLQEVHLMDGRTLPCDLFLVAAGIQPNVELARDSGLEVNRGVLVDDTMRTSDQSIFAAGDVAEHRGQVYGLWPTAVEQAEIAAVNAVGGEKSFPGSVPVTMLKVVGIDVMSVGRYTRESPNDVAIATIEDEAGGHRYRRLLISGGRIAGAILIGYPKEAPTMATVVRQRLDVSAYLDQLKAGEWDVLARLADGPVPV